jgi:YD repeat-containing protein
VLFNQGNSQNIGYPPVPVSAVGSARLMEGSMHRFVRGLCGGLFLCLAIAPLESASAADATYIYDALGRLAHVEYGNTTISYTYDKAGNRTAVATAPNGAPTAVNDNVTTTSGVVTFDPRFNDTDPDGDPLTTTSVNTPIAAANGTPVINSGTTITYTANANYHGSDSFSYTISDGHSHTSTATVSVTVP